VEPRFWTQAAWVWGVDVPQFKFDWGQHAEAGVAAAPVVEDLEVFEDRVGEFDSRLPAARVEEFDLHP
jgi:hypothetical protein